MEWDARVDVLELLWRRHFAISTKYVKARTPELDAVFLRRQGPVTTYRYLGRSRTRQNSCFQSHRTEEISNNAILPALAGHLGGRGHAAHLGVRSRRRLLFSAGRADAR